MKAKRAAGLLLGMLVLAVVVVWSQVSDKVRPTCPPLEDEFLQSILRPTAWIKADWNANAKQWEIRCKEIDAIANMGAYVPGGPLSDVNAANTGPRKKRPVKRPPHEE